MTANAEIARFVPEAKSKSGLMRSLVFFLLGALAGYYWLLPVFVPPGSTPLTEAGLSIERIMRVLGVLLIFPLVARRAIRLSLRERILRLVFWVFVLVPAVSLLFEPNMKFIIGTYGPFLAAGLSLICLAALEQEEFKAWMAGVGLAATVFLIIGLCRYGLGPIGGIFNNTDRIRSHIGFIHPTQTASVIFFAGLFSIQFIRWLLRRLRWLRWLVMAGIIAGMVVLLLAASSRNTALAAFLIIICAVYALAVKESLARLGLVLTLLLAPLVGYAVAVFGDIQSELWMALDAFSSYRFITYRELAERFSEISPLMVLIGSPQWSAGGGFASAESVYMSVYLNFGLLTLTGLFVFLLMLGWRLSKARRPLAYGCLCAVIIFFAIDAQGITPSNLAIFLLLVYAVRTALSRSMIPSRISLGSRSV